PLDLSKDTKPYIKLRSLRYVHWDQQNGVCLRRRRNNQDLNDMEDDIDA
ncbi:hypothetical protein Tco_1034318, partial [Tanacetum coccineum]